MTPEIIAVIDAYDVKQAFSLSMLRDGSATLTEFNRVVGLSRERLVADIVELHKTK